MAPPEPLPPAPQVPSLDAHAHPHAHGHTPLSWGYPSSAWNTPVGPTPVSGPRAHIKRALSESDDCDDVFSEESQSKDQCSGSVDGEEADSCQLLSRKKRRGVIEKRRRDRINTSLTELRRLVPSAFEKQGSAKLEKAEILQMTVDHLKMLHAKGMDALAYDPQRFAMDYHNIGFRECAAEVARYLVTVEGLDIQDPLRLRLMSHLQCFAAQRELASKQAASATWSYGTSPTTNYPAATPATPTPTSGLNGSHTFPTPPSSGHGSLQQLDTSPTNSSTASSTHQHSAGGYDSHTATSCEQTPTSTGSTPSGSGSASRHITSPLTPLSSSSMAPGYPPASPSHPHAHAHAHAHPYYHSQYPMTYHQNAFNPGAPMAGSKPYRPWGAEVAY